MFTDNIKLSRMIRDPEDIQILQSDINKLFVGLSHEILINQNVKLDLLLNRAETDSELLSGYPDPNSSWIVT